MHLGIQELLHDKTNKMICAPSKDKNISDQPGHLPSLISLHCVLNGRDFSDPFRNGSGICPFGKNSSILLQVGNFHGLVRCIF